MSVQGFLLIASHVKMAILGFKFAFFRSPGWAYKAKKTKNN